ncbi:regulator of G-protein signaling 22 [Plakobranchus ocellatus]|uniref:Regulator of G-protein signaling 22 n=1 Tax=Plakobranchus ocellatus TaxID=259542 RepID=A0AAV3Y9I6_9GAST|nr:regulator of G-protein signaling 22 [Plakobranchus ocellatus]
MVNSSADEFFREDLAWPDPGKLFPDPSGIRPEVLSTNVKHFRALQKRMDGGQMGLTSRCAAAKAVRMAARPTTLPWNILVIHSDPPTVDEDDVEEFLVHDPLFVEFFNAFLSLPSFPEPICFNVATGGFEVVSDAKRRLAAQIKEAVRSQNLTAKMYRVARSHAFSNIPLIPIEDTQQGPETVKIDTSFDVTTLNKDQGIYWIKAERLPIFLESDYYFQYRLAKVISQARIFNDKGEFIVMKIDFTTRPKKKKVSVEVPPPNLEEIIMKEMFVSFGDVRGAAKEDWFNMAKAELQNKSDFTSLGSQTAAAPEATTSSLSMSESKLESVTPSPSFTRHAPEDSICSLKKSSVFHSHFFGVYSPGIIGPHDHEPPVIDKETMEKHMQEEVHKPFTPRPNERMFQSTAMVRKKITPDVIADEEMVPAGVTVYVRPKQDLSNVDAESGIGEMEEREEDFEKRMNEQPIIDQLYHDGSWEQGGANIALKTLDELGSVIVGAVMKKTIAEMLEIDEAKVIADPTVSSIYPSHDLTCVSVSDLDLCHVAPQKRSPGFASDVGLVRSKELLGANNERKDDVSRSSLFEKGQVKSKDTVTMGSSPYESKSVVSQSAPVKEPMHIKWEKPMKKAAEDESDADSLLDSDEDFEERDNHFRRNKNKWHRLNSWKGISAFKKFLSGTSGEKYWHLWIDIDKGKLIHSEEDKQRYIMHMRNSYHRKGSPYELSAEDKKKLGLENLSSWCPEYLYQIHAKVLEPLVLYWAPRYLLRNLMRAHPEKYKEYNEMKACQPPQESDPFPQTAPLLPLRPKSCCPRTGTGHELEKKQTLPPAFTPKEPSHGTSPMVGNHRVYGEDTIRRLANTPSAKYVGLRSAGQVRPPSGGRQSSFSASHGARSGRRLSTPASLTFVQPTAEPGGGSGGAAAPHAAAAPAVARAISGSAVSDEAFVGKMRGVSSELSNVNSRGVSEQMSSGTILPKRQKQPCLSKNLDHILGESKSQDRPFTALPSLGVVKKPKDLLSPMLKIVDTKQQAKSKRIRSAPAPTVEKGVNSSTFYRQDSQSSSRKCPGDILSGADPSDGGFEEPGDAAEPGVQMVAIQDCDFMGSTRLEFLLQALHHEDDSGRTFRKYIEKSGRQDWINNLDFWEKVQQYRKLFYKDKLDLFLISWQAKTICAQCIVEGCEKPIGVSESVELQVLERLSPAYECLFDEAEEHALKKLFEAFQLYLGQDVKTYCKVERTSVTRRLETKNTYILNLQKKGIIKERPLTPDDPMEGYVDPVYDESVLERIPERFRDWTLDKLLHNRIELEHFRLFLAENYAEVDLKCWMDIETWRRTPHEEDKKRDQRARDIKKNYLNKKYFFGPSSPAGKEGQNKVMEVGGGWGKFLEDKPHSRSILEAQKYVRERLEKKHLLWFLASKEFQDRQSPKLSMSDSADDVVTQKRKRTAAVLKVFRAQEERFYAMIRRQPPLKPGVSHLILPPIDKGQKKSGVAASLDKGMGDKAELDKSPIVTPRSTPTPGKLLESRWVTSAKEINCFRQALRNPLTCELFQQFVSLQGEHLENDVLFWLEVQKYKVLKGSPGLFYGDLSFWRPRSSDPAEVMICGGKSH